jgi:hypothetical protein
VWLALQLHKRNKARILLPDWLSSHHLAGAQLQRLLLLLLLLLLLHTDASAQHNNCVPA